MFLQVRNVLLTVALFCGPMLLTFSFLNTVAIAYHSTAALPFGTICVIFVIWALITFPLTVLGGIAGKNKQVSLCCCLHSINLSLEGHLGMIASATQPKPNPMHMLH